MMSIRYLSRLYPCRTVGDLWERLRSEFQGDSVSVIYTGRSGMKSLLFLDVAQDGGLSMSYGEQEIVTRERLALLVNLDDRPETPARSSMTQA